MENILIEKIIIGWIFFIGGFIIRNEIRKEKLRISLEKEINQKNPILSGEDGDVKIFYHTKSSEVESNIENTKIVEAVKVKVSKSKINNSKKKYKKKNRNHQESNYKVGY